MGYGPQTLGEMARDVFAWAGRKGWEPTADTFGDSIALIHSEASEALEAYRRWGLADATKTEDQIRAHHSIGSPHGFCNHSELPGQCEYASRKPEGVGSEFADILIRLLHYCARYGIDLEAEYHRKMAYNEGRPYRHGGKAL
jgi:NTP pyrophosphatase (non-canonical NTP hydrolase)